MKNIFRFLMAVAVLFTVSCAKEDISSSIGGGEVEMTFTVDLQDLGSRAYGDGAYVNTLRYYVYDGNSYLDQLSGQKPIAVGAATTVNLVLLKGMTYNIVFWADHDGYYTYDTAAKTITVDYSKVTANEEWRDAFCKFVPSIDPATASNDDKNIVLTRPFAQLNAVATDMNTLALSGVNISKSYVTIDAYSTLNLATGNVTGLAPKTLVAGNILENGLLSMNYFLAPADGYTPNVTFTFENNKNIDFGASFTYVPLKRNYRTNIIGSLLSKSTDFTVTIDPAFGNPDIDEWEQVADGVTRYQNDYYLSNAAGLFWLAGEVNKYDNYEHPFEGKTVYLTTDIDLQGAEWIPIGDYRFSANRFCGTFDGQNHTISNFKISKDTEKNDGKKSSYGFFGNVKGTIKNLTIDNASVTAYAYTAILVGRLTDGTLENCHVKNSSVVNNYWQAGGLVGQQNNVCNIKNCSVDNVTVQAKSCVGLLVGPMTNEKVGADTVSTIEDCSVKNSKIIQRGSQGTSYDKMFGVINPDVEFNNHTLNINNFTSENNSFDRNGVNADLALYAGLEGNVFIDGVCVSVYGLTVVNGYTALFRDNAGDYCLLNKQSLIDWHTFLTKDTTRNPYNCNVKMLADIDADGWTWNSLWITPAANNLTGLQFDGQNHTISNLNIAGEGMFSASLAGMAFKNLTINGVEVNVASTGHTAAVFAGAAYSSVSFENVAVKNATVNGPCNTGIFVGGTNEPNNLVISFKNCSVEKSSVTATGKDYQDPTGASGFVGKAYGSTKLVFEGTNSIDDATTITNHNGLVGGKAYGYSVYANGGWTGTGASDEFVNWNGLN